MDHEEFEREQIPLDELDALLSANATPLLAVTEDHINSILAARRARHDLFGEGLFSDPAWEILLELYAAELAQRPLSPADLVRSISAPPSVVQRWLDTLAERSLIESENSDAVSGQSVKLTSAALTRLARLAQHWTSAFLRI